MISWVGLGQLPAKLGEQRSGWISFRCRESSPEFRLLWVLGHPPFGTPEIRRAEVDPPDAPSFVLSRGPSVAKG